MGIDYKKIATKITLKTVTQCSIHGTENMNKKEKGKKKRIKRSIKKERIKKLKGRREKLHKMRFYMKRLYRWKRATRRGFISLEAK